MRSIFYVTTVGGQIENKEIEDVEQRGRVIRRSCCLIDNKCIQLLDCVNNYTFKVRTFFSSRFSSWIIWNLLKEELGQFYMDLYRK